MRHPTPDLAAQTEDHTDPARRLKFDRSWRKVAVLAVVAALFAILAIIGTQQASTRAITDVAAERDRLRGEVKTLSVSVDVNARQSECRSKIANYVSDVTEKANALTRQGLADSVIARSPENQRAVALAITDYNNRLAVLSDVRRRSVEVCADNVDYEMTG